MFRTMLSRRHSEDVRVLEFIHAVRATDPNPPTVELQLSSRTDTVQFPRIILTLGSPL